MFYRIEEDGKFVDGFEFTRDWELEPYPADRIAQIKQQEKIAQPLAPTGSSSLPADYGPPPTDACKQMIQDHYHRAFGPHLAFQFGEPAHASVDDPELPGQKIHGWLFEARWNFKPPAKSNFPMAGRFLARGDTIVLTAPLAGPFERWDAKVATDEGKKQ